MSPYMHTHACAHVHGPRNQQHSACLSGVAFMPLDPEGWGGVAFSVECESDVGKGLLFLTAQK